jgi:signal peptidase II
LKRYLRNYFELIVMGGIIVGLDQWTKYVVRTQLAFGESWTPWKWLEPYVRIVHWRNAGAAFGMFQGFGGVFTILAILVAIAIVYYFPQVPRGDWVLRLAMGLQFGGAIGNLIDRLTQGGFVTDFVSVGNFPVFNVADASISVGVAILILGMWINERKEKEKPPSPDSEESSSDHEAASSSFPDGFQRE